MPVATRVEGDGALPTAGALIDVTAECRSAATDDGGQDLQMQPGEPFPTALVKGGSGCADQVGTSSGGRATYFAASESASRGLAVAPIWRFDKWM